MLAQLEDESRQEINAALDDLRIKAIYRFTAKNISTTTMQNQDLLFNKGELTEKK